MIATTPKSKCSLEDFLALPDDGVDRELIRGEIRENGLTYRNRSHARTEARVVHLLESWLEKQSQERGAVLSGESGFRLQSEPATIVGIDVAYISAETVSRLGDEAKLVDQPPVLAVEILSPSNDVESIHEKIRLYLESGVKLVWIVDPEFRTVVVHQSGAQPTMFNAEQEITAEPFLPGFRAQIVKFFEI